MKWTLEDVDDEAISNKRDPSNTVAGGWHGEVTAHYKGENGFRAVLTYAFDTVPPPFLVSVELKRHYLHGTIGRRDLREVPLGELERMFFEHLAQDYGARVLGDEDSPEAIEVPNEVKAVWPKGDLTPLYEYVERVYNDAIRRRQPPTLAVADGFEVSRGTASRMIAKARAASYQLEPPVPFSGPKNDRKNGNDGAAETGSR